eukprot:CFRG4531T1
MYGLDMVNMRHSQKPTITKMEDLYLHRDDSLNLLPVEQLPISWYNANSSTSNIVAFGGNPMSMLLQIDPKIYASEPSTPVSASMSPIAHDLQAQQMTDMFSSPWIALPENDWNHYPSNQQNHFATSTGGPLTSLPLGSVSAPAINGLLYKPTNSMSVDFVQRGHSMPSMPSAATAQASSPNNVDAICLVSQDLIDNQPTSSNLKLPSMKVEYTTKLENGQSRSLNDEPTKKIVSSAYVQQNGTGNFVAKETHLSKTKRARGTRANEKKNADATCAHCGIGKTTLWRCLGPNEVVCNACGLYKKKHGVPRPLQFIERHGGVIRRRRRNQNDKGEKANV